MTMPTKPTDPLSVPGSQWQVPSSSGTDYQILPWLRSHVVVLVAALLVQATIALLGVLPNLPVAPVVTDPDAYYYPTQPVSFWAQFAVIEFIAAVVVALAFRPGARFGDVPAIVKVVLGLGFVVLPAAAIVLGGLDAAQTAGRISPTVAASTWLTTTFFGTLFFGLPLFALAAPGGRASTKTVA